MNQILRFFDSRFCNSHHWRRFRGGCWTQYANIRFYVGRWERVSYEAWHNRALDNFWREDHGYPMHWRLERYD